MSMRFGMIAAAGVLMAGCGGGGGGDEIPAAPTGLAAQGETVLGVGRADVSWNAVAGATRYLVSVDGAAIADPVPAMQAALEGLEPGRSYVVEVRARNAAGDGPPATQTVTPPVPPPAPTAVTLADTFDPAIGIDHVAVTWAAAQDAAGYAVYRSDDGGQTWALRGETAETAYADPLAGGEVCTRLRYRVASTADHASSARSEDEAVRGTILSSSTSTGAYATSEAGSPWIVEGSVTLEASQVVVSARTALCLAAGSTLSLPEGTGVLSYGVLRATGSAARPARLTAHAPGGAEPTSAISLSISEHWDDAVSYAWNPATDRGAKLEYLEAAPLWYPDFGGAGVFQCKFTTITPSPVTISDGNPHIERSTFEGFWLSITGSHPSSAGMLVSRNVFTGGYWTLELHGMGGSGAPADTLAPGALVGNVFAAPVAADQYTSSGVLPLGGNYWGGGMPELWVTQSDGAEVTADFAPVLTDRPEAGASW